MCVFFPFSVLNEKLAELIGNYTGSLMPKPTNIMFLDAAVDKMIELRLASKVCIFGLCNCVIYTYHQVDLALVPATRIGAFK